MGRSDMSNKSITTGSVTGRHDVEQLMQDEFLESLTSSYDFDALSGADRCTYVLHQSVAYEYAAPVRDLRQRLMVMPNSRHGDQQRVVHRFDVRARGTARTRTRADRFGNPVVHVSVPVV